MPNVNASQKYSPWKRKLIIAHEDFLHALHGAHHVIRETTETTPELLVHGGGFGVIAPEHLAGVIHNIPEMIHLSKDSTKSLFDVAETISMKTAAEVGVVTSFNYIAAISAIIAGLNLILDETDYRQTQNKFKGVLNIISGAATLGLSYNPAIAVATGLSATTFAAPAFAFIELCNLINASVDFYHATKVANLEGWLEERIKEINFIDERLDKLTSTLDFHDILSTEKKGQSEKEKNLTDKIKQKKDALQEKRNDLYKELIARSKVYYHDGQDINTPALQTKNDPAYEAIRKENFLKEQFNKLKSETYGQNRIVNSITTNKPTNEEKKLSSGIQKTMVENYHHKRFELLIKGLTFTALALLAVAPFAGPGAPVLYATGLVLGGFLAGYHLYKHRYTFKRSGEKIIQQTKDLLHKAHNSLLFHSETPTSKNKKQQTHEEGEGEKEGEGKLSTPTTHPK